MPQRFRDEDCEPIHDDDDDESKETIQTEAIKFGSQPVSIKCPFCLQHTRTQIIAKPELVSIVFGLVLFSIIPNAVMIIIVVVALQLTATKKHRCSLCERQLGTDGKFLLVFTDQVYSFSFGETGILISKKILVTTGLFISIFIIISIKGNMNSNLNWSDMSWETYKSECPTINILNANCLSKYQGVTIKNWKGFVMRVEDQRQSIKRFYDHAVKIYVKMNPSQQAQYKPDLILTGSSSIVFQFQQILDNLRHGDQITFNATILKSSRETEVPQGRHLHLYDLNKTGIHDDNIEIYVKADEEEYMENKVEGQKLRKQKSDDDLSENLEKLTDKQSSVQIEKQMQKQKKTNKIEQNMNNKDMKDVQGENQGKNQENKK